MKEPVFIIAEAGVNHNGSVTLAKKLIDQAVYAGVDAVKFQTWKTELLITKEAKLAKYQEHNIDSDISTQFEMAKALELTYENFRELKTYCVQKEILFLSTPDEEESAKFLLELQDIFKIGSGELNNLPLLRLIGSFGKKVILSTGMSDIGQIENALDVLIEAGMVKENITILHANTEYPTPMCDVNLKAMQTIENTFKINVGYSDHTLGIEVPIAAVAMGARVIEKHFTLDKNMDGPDHIASLDPTELKLMVIAIRNIELALGDGIKKVTKSERPNIEVIRKSIVARCEIKKGELLTVSNLTVKRAKHGACPMSWDSFIGSYSKKDYEEDELI
jgi:N,N'-diacetyllegionaminate synthase